jgi:hypothetical protein
MKEVSDGNDLVVRWNWCRGGRLGGMEAQGTHDNEAGHAGGAWRPAAHNAEAGRDGWSATHHAEVKVTALWLLAAGMAAQFMWQWAPAWAQADAWNSTSAVFIVMLLGLLVASHRRSTSFVLVCCYLAALWLLTAGCSLLWLKEQWTVLPGQDQCDARFKIPLSVMSLFVGLMVLVSIRSGRGRTDPKH